jgi:hypothetical protein
MQQPTIEELKEELAAVDRKLAAAGAKSDFQPDMDFALKTEIGGIRSESRRKKNRRIDRWDREAAETTELVRRKRDLTGRIAAMEEREATAGTRRAQRERHIDVLKACLKKGDRVEAGDYQAVGTVTRVNVQTVSFIMPSGFADRLPFEDIRPLEMARMIREYDVTQGEVSNAQA